MDRLEKARRTKLDRLRELGVDPFGQRVWNPRWNKKDDQGRPIYDLEMRSELSSIGLLTTKQCRPPSAYSSDKTKSGPWEFVCGRITSKNNKGKLKFFFIEDETGKIQTMFSRSEFTEDEWEIIKCLEINDIISVGGFVMTTEAGETTIFVGGYELTEGCNLESPLKSERIGGVTVLCKSLAHPPEKFHGISDEELLVRKRHLGISADKTLRDNLITRSRLVASMRSFLSDKNFLEVETPILSSQASGATAKPFDTHHNAMDMPLKLRIAPELYLKRLLVGGIPRVYEIGKVFRNEGVDRTHNPEFTILELYQAYGDLDDMMRLTKDLICYVMPEAKNQKWQIRTYEKAMSILFPKDVVGGVTYASIYDESFRDLWMERAKAPSEIDDDPGYQGDDYWEAIEHLFDKRVQPMFDRNWTFITDYPTALCPLAKPNPDGKTSGRFELFTQYMEIANAYTELNDPDVQLKMFEEQGVVDEAFIDALKLGMPPAGGLGIGVDRLVMLATESHSIRDVITFPLVKDSD